MNCFCIALSLAGEPAVTSTVQADRRTGRLVRRIVVAEKVVPPRTVSPLDPARPAAKPALAPVRDEKIDTMVNQAATENQVDPLLVHAIIGVESAYQRYAISPKGAEGLMQLIPATARRMGVANSFDSRQNIEGGVRYLKQLQDRFADLRLVLAAYNAGEHAVERFRGIPPYAETQEYVYKVGRRYGDLRRTQKSVEAPPAPPKTVPPAAEHRPLEAVVDQQGRLHLRTR